MTCRCVRLGVWTHVDGSHSFSASEAEARTATSGPVLIRYAKPWHGCGYQRGTPSCPPNGLSHLTDNDSLRELARFA